MRKKGICFITLIIIILEMFFPNLAVWAEDSGGTLNLTEETTEVNSGTLNLTEKITEVNSGTLNSTEEATEVNSGTLNSTEETTESSGEILNSTEETTEVSTQIEGEETDSTENYRTTSNLNEEKEEDNSSDKSDNERNGENQESNIIKINSDKDLEDFASGKLGKITNIDLGDGDLQEVIYEGKTIVLTKDIDLAGKNFNPLNNFAGIFDGQNHKITNVNSSEGGIFLDIYNAEIKDLTVTGTVEASGENTGGIVRYMNNSEISNCHSNVNIKCDNNSTISQIGGVVGYAQGSNITRCSNKSNISLKSGEILNIGGIVGETRSTSIDECNNSGNFEIEVAPYSKETISSRIGGIVGNYVDSSSNDLQIQNCYNSGRLQCKNCVDLGGIIGYGLRADIINCYNNGDLIVDGDFYRIAGIVACNYNGKCISKCYNTGKIEANCTDGNFQIATIGGISGENSGHIKNCYNIGNISGAANWIGGICGTSGSYTDTIINCYNKGDIFADNEFVEDKNTITGGIVGEVPTNNPSKYTTIIENCYNSSNISAKNYEKNIGYIYGDARKEQVSNCYYEDNGSVTHNDESATDSGAVAFTDKTELLNSLNANIQSQKGELDLCDWIKGDNGYPTLNIKTGGNNNEDENNNGEDNTETLVLDLALRNSIVRVERDGKNITSQIFDKNEDSREPQIDTEGLKKGTTAYYVHPKNAIEIKKGDYITYKINVYNEGDKDGFANEIKVYLQPGLEFVKSDTLNLANEWEYDEQSNSVSTKILSNTKSKDNVIKSSEKKDSKDIEDKGKSINLKVKVANGNSKYLTCRAEITSYGHNESDKKIKVSDKDSTPNSIKDTLNLKTWYENNINSDKIIKTEKGNYYPGEQDDDDFETVSLSNVIVEQGLIYEIDENTAKAKLIGYNDEIKNQEELHIAQHLRKGNELYSVEEIAENALSNGGFKSVYLPNIIKTIGASAFNECASLEKINLPDSLETIREGAFGGCVSLKNGGPITIPRNVSSMPIHAFSTFDVVLNIDENNNYYSCDENGILYNKERTILYGATRRGTSDTFVVPEGVTEIKDNAFVFYGRLKEITIGRTVSIIENPFNYDSLGEGEQLTIKGYRGTAAESYANTHDRIDFVDLDGYFKFGEDNYKFLNSSEYFGDAYYLGDRITKLLSETYYEQYVDEFRVDKKTNLTISWGRFLCRNGNINYIF